MAKTVTIKASNPISEDQRAQKLQYLQDNLSDEQLDKLHQLATNPKARQAIVTKFNFIKNFL